ncbi:MAG TPA: hypothetical protein VHV77_08485, partial [Pirellulales bacterium]|nr:hypothetical protein [Pirellulales bacterium]
MARAAGWLLAAATALGAMSSMLRADEMSPQGISQQGLSQQWVNSSGALSQGMTSQGLKASTASMPTSGQLKWTAKPIMSSTSKPASRSPSKSTSKSLIAQAAASKLAAQTHRARPAVYDTQASQQQDSAQQSGDEQASRSLPSSRHPREVLEPEVQEALAQFEQETPTLPTAGEEEVFVEGELLAPRLMPALPVERVARLPVAYQPAMPRFEDSYQRATQSLDVDCDVERSKLKPIKRVTTNIVAEAGDFPPECGSANSMFAPRCWEPLTYTWKASNLCHAPLYFEDVQAERYGHVWPRPFQPLVSTLKFFGGVILLPYNIGMELPNE